MTETQLANMALAHLGQARIADINEASVAAEHCRRMWDGVRDQLLREHHWNFATRRVALTARADAPPFGWSKAFPLPGDCLRVLSVNGIPGGVRCTAFEVEGRDILSNSDTCQLVYCAVEDAVSRWDAVFCRVFSYMLAAAIAPSFRLDPNTVGQMLQLAEQTRMRANEADAAETKPRVIRMTDCNDVLAAREQAGATPYGVEFGLGDTETPSIAGAPATADYLVRTPNSILSAERVVTDSTTITAFWGTAGQVEFRRAAFTGDVTAPVNSNTTTIATNAVTTAKIADGAVTLPKLDVIQNGHVVGRHGAGTGPAQTISVAGNGLQLSGASLVRSALTGAITAPAGSNTTTLANNAVTTDKIAANAINSEKIADGAVGTVALADGGVTLPKLAPANESVLIGRGSGAGSGDPQEIQLGSGLQMTGTTLVVDLASGSKTIAKFTARDGSPPATNFATQDTRGITPVLVFDGGSTNEEWHFFDIVPDGAVMTFGLHIDIEWMAATATTGQARWGAQIANLSTQDADTLTFAAASEANGTANATSGRRTRTRITIPSGNIGSLTAGDRYALRVYRVASDTVNDTLADFAQLAEAHVITAN